MDDPEEEITEGKKLNIIKCSLTMTPHPHIPYQHIHQEAECDLPEEVTSQLLQNDVNTDC